MKCDDCENDTQSGRLFCAQCSDRLLKEKESSAALIRKCIDDLNGGIR